MFDDSIYDLIAQGRPCMIARFGANEIKATIAMQMAKPLVLPFYPILKKRMSIQSGFFPANYENLKRFSNLMLDDSMQLDILGSWRIEERLLANHLKHVKKVPLVALEPYFSSQPWSRILKGKKVLVIHPFAASIEYQYYNNRKELFFNAEILPEFETLQTIQAVQSIAGNDTKFDDWFQALDYLKDEILKKEFDVAIIGCGAYGFPLAAFIKRIGKQAVHLGGATQILFGIKGKRWVDDSRFSTIINDHFIYPMDAEKPRNAYKVENGCYW